MKEHFENLQHEEKQHHDARSGKIQLTSVKVGSNCKDSWGSWGHELRVKLQVGQKYDVWPKQPRDAKYYSGVSSTYSDGRCQGYKYSYYSYQACYIPMGDKQSTLGAYAMTLKNEPVSVTFQEFDSGNWPADVKTMDFPTTTQWDSKVAGQTYYVEIKANCNGVIETTKTCFSISGGARYGGARAGANYKSCTNYSYLDTSYQAWLKVISAGYGETDILEMLEQFNDGEDNDNNAGETRVLDSLEDNLSMDTTETLESAYNDTMLDGFMYEG